MLGPLQAHPQNVVRKALVSRDLGERTALDSGFEDDPSLEPGDGARRGRVQQHPRDVDAQIGERRRCGDLSKVVTASAALALELAHRPLERFQEKVCGDPTRSSFEWVASDPLPGVQEQELPQFVALGDVVQRVSGDPFQAGHERLQHEPRGERVIASDAHEWSEQLVLRRPRLGPAQERKQARRIGEGRQRRLAFCPMAQARGEHAGGELPPLAVEACNRIEGHASSFVAFAGRAT